MTNHEEASFFLKKVSATDNGDQDIKINYLKHKIYDKYKKDEKNNKIRTLS